MKYERLKESIHALYDMELHNSIMEQCIHQIDQKMATLMIYRDIPVPGKKWIHDTLNHMIQPEHTRLYN